MSNDWMHLSPYGMGQPGSPVQGNAGGMPSGGIQALLFRDPLDAKLAQQGQRMPGAEYPDGYLGTIQSRREDRLLDQLSNRSAQRSSERGVHKGDRIDPADYLWPPELNDMRGLMRQMKTSRPQPDGSTAQLKAAPMGTLIEQLTIADRELPMSPRGKMRPLIPEGAPDELRQKAMAALMPSWRI
jgi:hypothetical protein